MAGMINWFQIGAMAAATPFVFLWVFLYVKYQGKFDAVTVSLSAREYRMLELYFIGLGFKIGRASCRERVLLLV